MQKIYILIHEYITGKKGEYIEAKLIGLFSNIKTAKYVKRKYKKIEGFRDFHIKCFRIYKYFVRSSEKIKSVYLLQHGYETGENDEYTVSVDLGVYRTEAEANKEMEKYAKEEPFNQFPLDCFYIGHYKLGECYWDTGFFDYEEEEEEERKSTKTKR